MSFGTVDDHPEEEGARQIAMSAALRTLGLVLILAAAAAVVSLATWNVDDPSFSYVSEARARNWLGAGGAAFADLAMQFLGLASIGLILPFAIWGWRLVGGASLRRPVRRVALWILGLASLGAALSSLPTPAAWPLPTALGGATGDLVLGVPEWLAGGAPSRGFYAAAAVIFAGLATGLLAGACGDRLLTRSPRPAARPAAPRRDRAGETLRTRFGRPEGSVALVAGAIQHWCLATVGHLKRRRQARLAAASAEAQRIIGRVEPGLSRREPRFALRAADAGCRPADDDNGKSNPQWSSGDDELEAVTLPVRRPPTLRIPEAWRFGRKAAEARASADARAHLPDGTADTSDIGHDGFDGLAELAEGAAFDLAQAEGLAATRDASEPQASGATAARRPLPPLRAGKTGRDKGGPRKAAVFRLPPLNLLAPPPQRRRDPTLDAVSLEENARLLEGVLDDFGVRGEIINVRPGPVVTLYELEPAPGIKSSRVISLADDIARSMSAIAARVAVVPGRNVIGIELPNASRETVFLREQVASKDFEGSKARLALTLGKTIGGEPVIADLAKMPHLLVAGTTGSGKSVAINTMILSLVYRLTPEQCRLIMIDPKMLELSIYDGIPHLLTPVVTDPKKAVVALKWTVREMEDRYRKMSKIGVRNVDGFNQRVTQALADGETLSRTVQTGFDDDSGEPVFETEELDLQPMPYIVVIIDEMADLMMVAGKEIEGAVQRLAQMARAAGIHVIMATQRPSVDVITGTIKANFPTRISFQVTSKIDSRTILGEQGAEQLLGQGDMLYMAGGGRIQRVHGPFVSDGEVEAIVAHLKAQGAPDYLEAITVDDEEDGGGAEGAASVLEESGDLYDQAVAVVLRDRKASTSYIQRRLAIGYNRAASLIEKMEKEGIVGSANHAGKREILVGENAA